MKAKKKLTSFVLLLFMTLQFTSIHCQTNDYNYSVKNRWTLKASVSGYKTAFFDEPFMWVGDNSEWSKMRKMANFKLETNYGINKFIEVGIFTGFQHYEWAESYAMWTELNKCFALLFGVNANFHILPFFVKSKECHWDLYITAKYGGCYLPYKEIDQSDFPYSKYRHEYGLGLGIGYYIKNMIGFFVEGSVGQYSYFKSFKIGVPQDGGIVEFKDFTDSNFSFRIGVATKF